MDACWICSQRHWKGGVLVPPRPDPFQACEHRDEQPNGFFSDKDRAAIRQSYQKAALRPARPLAPPIDPARPRRHLPGSERLERTTERRAAYLRETGRTEAA